ncbi:MAG: hypothetical protein JOZ15_21285 [Acidobacteria bacterium]|nr:hypothetical protein [Acidobacteriota bacterium]
MLSRHFSCLPAAFPLTLAVFAVLAGLHGDALLAQNNYFGPPLAVSCPFYGQGYADLSHGFYVTGYPGTNLSLVTLGYNTPTPGLFSISLTARRNSYDGPMIGTTQTATVDVGTVGDGETLVTFDFGGAPVTYGDTVTFTQTWSQLSDAGKGFGYLLYDAGRGNCASGIFETQYTSPPLDTVTGQGVGVSIYQQSPPTQPSACIPSDTVLCVDDFPGDRRFRVSASFQTVQGGGRSGKAGAIPLSPLGVVHGGLLWFFGADNPEMVIKIVNGCTVNDRYWAFVSAGTNVGFSVTIDDTVLVASKTYTNADLTAALPVQDTGALASCGPCTSNADCRSGLLCCPTPRGGNLCLAGTPDGHCLAIP